MPPNLRKLLIITGIILFLLLIGFFLARYLKPNTQQIETINLPNIIDKLTPKSG
jgi:hypothetical protein